MHSFTAKQFFGQIPALSTEVPRMRVRDGWILCGLQCQIQGRSYNFAEIQGSGSGRRPLPILLFKSD
jgi:hypothetical protein